MSRFLISYTCVKTIGTWAIYDDDDGYVTQYKTSLDSTAVFRFNFDTLTWERITVPGFSLAFVSRRTQIRRICKTFDALHAAYVVRGGQYESYLVGYAATLQGAKRLASRNCEYWDNWQGWHYPCVYEVKDTVPARSFYGVTRVERDDGIFHPYWFKSYDDGRWHLIDI